MGKVKLYFKVAGLLGKVYRGVGHYFGKSLSIDLLLTYRFVYSRGSDKFAYSES